MSYSDIVFKTLDYKGYSVFHKVIAPIPERSIKPFEQNEACFMFVNEGKFSVRSPEELIPFDKGKGMLAKCFDFYVESTKQQREENGRMELIGIFIFPDIVEELMDVDLSSSTYSLDYNLKQVQVDALLENFRASIDLLLDNPELADEETIKTKLKEFILLISKTQSEPLTDFLASLFKLNSTDFEVTVKNNVYSNLSVSEFAKLAGMSVSSFKRKFSETYNESPKKYFDRMKLEKASTLLLAGDERVSNIAYDLGYETVSTFNRTFKSRYGVSPSQYRLAQTA